MFESFTEQAIKVIMFAQTEASRLNHDFIGTEQILLGLISERSGIAAKVLQKMGVSLNNTRVEVEKIIGRGTFVGDSEIPFTPKAKKLFELSLEEADKFNHDYIGTEHLLLGLIRQSKSVGATVLQNLGVNLATVRTEVLQMLGQSQTTPIPIDKPNLNQTYTAELPTRSIINIDEDVSPTEDSILLVALTQIMPMIGIMAIDVATNNNFNTFPFSVWAIPSIILMIVISYYKRNKNSDRINLSATILTWLIVILFYFWLTNPPINNTQLVLAGLLIRLQLLYSLNFNLGVSIANGLLLMGVAASLSQPVAFIPWLLIFLVVAIPTLILYHRYRIGLNSWETQWRQRKKSPQWQNYLLSPQKIFSYIVIIITFGLLISTILPRYSFKPNQPPFPNSSNGFRYPHSNQQGEGNGDWLNKLGEFLHRYLDGDVRGDSGNGNNGVNPIDGFNQSSQFFNDNLIGILLGILLLIILGLMFWLITKYLNRNIASTNGRKLHPVAKLYGEMLNLLAKKGYPKHPAQTPYEYNYSLNSIFISEQLEIITLISDSYVQWRYGNLTPNVDYLRSQFKLLKQSLKQIKRSQKKS